MVNYLIWVVIVLFISFAIYIMIDRIKKKTENAPNAELKKLLNRIDKLEVTLETEIYDIWEYLRNKFEPLKRKIKTNLKQQEEKDNNEDYLNSGGLISPSSYKKLFKR